MGRAEQAAVDIPTLVGVARQYAAVAGMVDGAVSDHLSRGLFRAADAGVDYLQQGEALRAGLDDTADRLRQWSRAAAEIGAVLRASALRYGDADERFAGRLGVAPA